MCTRAEPIPGSIPAPRGVSSDAAWFKGAWVMWDGSVTAPNGYYLSIRIKSKPPAASWTWLTPSNAGRETLPTPRRKRQYYDVLYVLRDSNTGKDYESKSATVYTECGFLKCWGSEPLLDLDDVLIFD
ncbi:hypothetical protein ATCCBAA256_38650 [Mycobacterium montefiorense]|nr:hypothetical protein ATCCBAA256_38650 [Mycobacterium montefiorense]